MDSIRTPKGPKVTGETLPESVQAPQPSLRQPVGRFQPQQPVNFRLYDAAEYSAVEYGRLKNYVVCFGRNQEGERVAVFVENIPHELYLAVPEGTTDEQRRALQTDLNNELLRINRSIHWCALTECPRCHPPKPLQPAAVADLVKDAPDDGDDGDAKESDAPSGSLLDDDSDEEVKPVSNSVKPAKKAGAKKAVSPAPVRRTAQSIKSEPCREDRKRDVRPVISSNFVRKRGFVGYEHDERLFIRFELSGAFYAREAQNFLLMHTSNTLCANLGSKKGCYEVCPNAVESIMRLKDMRGFMWYGLENYRARSKSSQRTHAKHEYIVDYKGLHELPRQPEPSDPNFRAPVVSLVLDIETISERPNGVSNPLEHPIGMVGVSLVNDLDPTKNERRIFTWGKHTVSAIEEPADDGITTKIQKYSSEVQMLMAFRAFIYKTDPDFLVGYNSNSFDLPYIFTRGKVLNEPLILDLSLFKNRPCRFMQVVKSSNQTGTRKVCIIDLPGRTCFDLYPFAQGRLKLRRYRMQDVIEHLEPGLKKGDMPYSDIHPYFHGTLEQRKKLLEYCILDAHLTSKILKNLSGVPTLVAQAQVFRSRPVDVLERGQLARNSRLVRGWTQGKYLIPSLAVNERIQMLVSSYNKYIESKLYMDLWGPGKSVVFDGGRVFDPQRGKHEFVACLDFNSLYPSIIRAHNLCHTTFVFSPEHAEKMGLKESDLRVTEDVGSEATKGERDPQKFTFVRETTKEGVLPAMLTSLLEARKRTKNLRDKCEDPRIKQALDAEQDSYKLCANSVYGLLGFRGELENIAAAAAVTSYGRYYISKAREVVEAKFADELDFVYGDTDSIMFSAAKSCGGDLDKARELGHRVADFLNSSGVYPKPMKIEFEKIFRTMLLEDKKRYAGHSYEAKLGSTKGKFFARGLEVVRRDFPPYVSDSLRELLSRMLIENKSDEDLMLFVREAGTNLLLGKVPAERLKTSASLTKPLDDYPSPARLPHVAAARVLQSQGLEIKPGDRIEYVLVERDGGLKSHKAVPWSVFNAPESTEKVDYDEYFTKLNGPFRRALFYLPEEKLEPLFDRRRYPTLAEDGSVLPPEVPVDEPWFPKVKRTKKIKEAGAVSETPVPALPISTSILPPLASLNPGLSAGLPAPPARQFGSGSFACIAPKGFPSTASANVPQPRLVHSLSKRSYGRYGLRLLHFLK